MKISAIAPWCGSKRNLAAHIIEELGPHRVYWELFGGSMSVLLTKVPCVMETVCEMHGDLTNLAWVLQDAELTQQLFARMKRTLMAESLFVAAAERIKSQPASEKIDVQRAGDYLLVTWLGRNGVAGTASYNHSFCVRYTANGGHAAKRWNSVVRSIVSWHRRLRNITILRRDAFELLPRIEDKKGTAIYADPPYITKNTKYVHDFTPDDHRRLATLLARLRETRVVVSYYDDPLLAELYPGWTKRQFNVSKAMAHQGKRGANDTRATEVLLVNGPSFADEKMLF